MLPCVRVCLFTDMPVDQLHRGPLSRGLRTSARLLIGGVHLGFGGGAGEMDQVEL